MRAAVRFLGPPVSGAKAKVPRPLPRNGEELKCFRCQSENPDAPCYCGAILSRPRKRKKGKISCQGPTIQCPDGTAVQPCAGEMCAGDPTTGDRPADPTPEETAASGRQPGERRTGGPLESLWDEVKEVGTSDGGLLILGGLAIVGVVVILRRAFRSRPGA